MNVVDATCTECGNVMVWLPGVPRICKTCMMARAAARERGDTTADHADQWLRKQR